VSLHPAVLSFFCLRDKLSRPKDARLSSLFIFLTQTYGIQEIRGVFSPLSWLLPPTQLSAMRINTPELLCSPSSNNAGNWIFPQSVVTFGLPRIFNFFFLFANFSSPITFYIPQILLRLLVCILFTGLVYVSIRQWWHNIHGKRHTN
jgi:hypothetical protein